MLDLEPATRMLARLVAGVRDDQLGAPTPCAEATVGDLLDHVDGCCLAFGAAAAKATPGSGGHGPSADASRLEPDWRTRIPARLAALAQAWRDEAAWHGTTRVAGLELPGEVAGRAALNEIVVHGWDIAVATGQAFDCEPELVQGADVFVGEAVRLNPEGLPGLFGPPVPVPDGAPPLDRLVAHTGRDPAWRASGG